MTSKRSRAERAAELLAEKRAKGPAPKKRPAKRTPSGCSRRQHRLRNRAAKRVDGEEGSRQGRLIPELDAAAEVGH